MFGIIGEKMGMTQVYSKDGSVVPVTVVRVKPNTVVGTKTRDKNGYNAVQLAFAEQKESRVNKPMLGVYKKVKLAPHKHIKEFRTDRSGEYKVGMQITIDGLKEGDSITVSGRSKGKGFQGVMKRYHFAGGCDSHGTSVAHRVPGSIGQGTDPGRIIKGTKLPGHMGDESVTVKNLEIAGVEAEQNILLVKGALPGSKSSRLYIYPQTDEFESKVLTEPEPEKEEKTEAKEAKETDEPKKEETAA